MGGARKATWWNKDQLSTFASRACSHARLRVCDCCPLLRCLRAYARALRAIRLFAHLFPILVRMPCQETGTYIVSATTVDEMQSLMDDHIIKTQTMKGSPFSKPFAENIEELEQWLLSTQAGLPIKKPILC